MSFKHSFNILVKSCPVEGVLEILTESVAGLNLWVDTCLLLCQLDGELDIRITHSDYSRIRFLLDQPLLYHLTQDRYRPLAEKRESSRLATIVEPTLAPYRNRNQSSF